jgi:RsmE family RNA methyltransferase
VNLILFDEEEGSFLSRTDPRYHHIRDVLKCRRGDAFDMGITNGPRGRARVLAFTEDGVSLEFHLEDGIPRLHPITLIVGLTRPQSARRILREATSLGTARIFFASTDRGEPSYMRSRLWIRGEYRRHLKEGASQAFCTRLPEVRLFGSLEEAVEIPTEDADRAALDNYEAPVSLAVLPRVHGACMLAVGSERGWSDRERDVLRNRAFRLAHLGSRVLRTETACIAGLTLLLAKRRLL